MQSPHRELPSIFIVKACYQGEIRKFSLPQSSFPTYDVLQTQVAHLFSISHAFYLSDIHFIPNGGSRVVVGSVVHDEAMYNDLIGPFRGQMWPNGLLRFRVISADSAPLLHPSLVNNEVMDSQGYINLGALHDAYARRPIPRQASTSGDSTALASHRSSIISQGSRQSCCPVSEGKQEVKSLMDSFLRDFNNIMSSTFSEVPDANAQPRSSSPETVIAEQPVNNNVDDTIDVTIPGAFYRPTYVEPAEKPAVHRGITCDFCGQRNIRGTRHHCLQCADFDLCDECVNERGAKSAHQVVARRGSIAEPHTFESIERPHRRPFGHPTRRSLATRATDLAGDSVSPSNGPVVHYNVVCDVCEKIVVGTRHKCLDCSDFDLCDTCYSRAERDHPPHQFVDIKTPGRVIVHRVYEPVEVPVTQKPPLEVAPVVHEATCDLCDSRIEGIRRKCVVCPDYDVCSSCFNIVPEHHPKHAFVKISETQDLAPRDPAAKKKHSARCDECGKSIRGIRYKCMHPECPDYDLCAKCEALPIEVHPSTHPLLKMRSPETIIPTVYRVGGTSLIEPPTPQIETIGIAIATEPEPIRTDVAVHTECATAFADASVHTEKGSDVNEVGVTTVTQEPLLLDASVSAILSLPSPPSFALRMPEEEEEEEDDVCLRLAETAEPEMSMIPESSFISSFISKFPRIQDAKPAAIVSSAFVGDVNVEDGQAFPAGAEFVKSWRIKNDGNVPWPESTILEFVAGDRLPAFNGAALSYIVGSVDVGEEVDVSAYDLKAPDVTGKYVSYWRLSDGGKPFGTSMWCDINVVAPSGPSSLGEMSLVGSLNSSEVIMPEPSPRRNPSLVSASDVEEAPSIASAASMPSTPSVTASTHSTDYDTESLLNDFENTSDDEMWEASREQAAPQAPVARAAANAVRSPASAGRVDPEYIVLYDETSGDEW